MIRPSEPRAPEARARASRPRIVLSTASSWREVDLRRVDALTGLNYSRAVVRAGGLPFMVGNLDPELAPEVLDGADGLLLTGGADVSPLRWGADPHPALGRVDPERDAFELALYRAARTAGLPVLGVCRGIQLVNVAEGGTLHQHLPALPERAQHEQRDLDGAPSHRVRLEPGSRLAAAYGSAEIVVNSFHHQAADRIGAGLRAVGRAPDGTVEAIEGASGAWLAAVQWHPEMAFERHPAEFAPFRAFLEAVREAQDAGRGALSSPPATGAT